jgi:hypothetical protein
MTATWHAFAQEAPELAAFVRSRFEATGLALLATIRADGSPRISGLEPVFHDGELWLAMMPDSVKSADLRRDGRFALHNATTDTDVSEGDVKVNGIATFVADRSRSGVPDLGLAADLFTTTLSSVSTIRVGDRELIIDSWRPGHGTTRRTRT